MYKELQKFGKVRSNEPLSKHTTFKIGGPAEFFVTVEETEKLIDLVRFLNNEGVPYCVIGGGSNMLVGDQEYKGVAINVKTQMSKVKTETRHVGRNVKTELFAEAGCITVAIAQLAMQNKLTGFEWGVGVPGTIGGAVRGNAGAMGGEMKNCVKNVTVFRDNEIIELTNAECEFGYRDSVFKHNSDIILSVNLELLPTESGEGMKKALEYLQYRNKTQPQGFASTGCIFKNYDVAEKKTWDPGIRRDDTRETAVSTVIPAEAGIPLQNKKTFLLSQFPADAEKIEHFFSIGKISAGWLVEKAGMKGRQIGNAKVSETHGNFIVNMGGAAASDVQALIDEIKSRVYTSCGIEIEEEIQIL